MRISVRFVTAARGVCGAAVLLVPMGAVAQAPTVYRCPGPPVLYTDTLAPAEARSRNCKPLTDLPVATAPPAAPRPGAAPTAGAARAAVAGAGTVSAGGAQATVPNVGGGALPEARVRPDDQRSRDAEARRILEAELRREEARLNDALKASAAAKPGERVGADAAQIRRAESDIEAIRRELSRLR